MGRWSEGATCEKVMGRGGDGEKRREGEGAME